jgi:hypothetical protein
MARIGTHEEDKRGHHGRTNDDFCKLFVTGEHGSPLQQPPFAWNLPFPLSVLIRAHPWFSCFKKFRFHPLGDLFQRWGELARAGGA